MSDMSDYLESKFIQAVFKGQAFPTISTIYVALHTSDPGETGIAEVTAGAWPAYARQDAAKGGAVSTGWTAESGGVVQNALQLIYPVFDGGVDLTCTHFSLWDSLSGGNMLTKGALATARTVQNGDVYVIDTQKLTVQAT